MATSECEELAALNRLTGEVDVVDEAEVAALNVNRGAEEAERARVGGVDVAHR